MCSNLESYARSIRVIVDVFATSLGVIKYVEAINWLFGNQFLGMRIVYFAVIY